MCRFSMEHILHSIKCTTKYHKIWGLELQGFRLKGFGLVRVYWIILEEAESEGVSLPLPP